jgi:hypothetical protein
MVALTLLAYHAAPAQPTSTPDTPVEVTPHKLPDKTDQYVE